MKRKALALGLTLGAIVFGLLGLGLVAVAPAFFDALNLSILGRPLLEVARWVLVLVLVVAGLAVVYRVAPDRDAPRFSWVSVGALVATVIWLVASVAVLVLCRQLRQLREDLWEPRRRCSPPLVAVDHLLHRASWR